MELEPDEPELANGVGLFRLLGERFWPNSGRSEIFSAILLQVVGQVTDLGLDETEPLDW